MQIEDINKFSKTKLAKWLSEDVSTVAIAIDNSGSMPPKKYVRLLQMVKDILLKEKKDFKVHCWDFSHEINCHQIYGQNTISHLSDFTVYDSAGTDFEINFEYMKKNNIKPTKLIVFTDGVYTFAGWGDPEYCDTMWILVNVNKKYQITPPPFGKWMSMK